MSTVSDVEFPTEGYDCPACGRTDTSYWHCHTCGVVTDANYGSICAPCSQQLMMRYWKQKAPWLPIDV